MTPRLLAMLMLDSHAFTLFRAEPDDDKQSDRTQQACHACVKLERYMLTDQEYATWARFREVMVSQ